MYVHLVPALCIVSDLRALLCFQIKYMHSVVYGSNNNSSSSVSKPDSDLLHHEICELHTPIETVATHVSSSHALWLITRRQKLTSFFPHKKTVMGNH